MCSVNSNGFPELVIQGCIPHTRLSGPSCTTLYTSDPPYYQCGCDGWPIISYKWRYFSILSLDGGGGLVEWVQATTASFIVCQLSQFPGHEHKFARENSSREVLKTKHYKYSSAVFNLGTQWAKYWRKVTIIKMWMKFTTWMIFLNWSGYIPRV
jgi:hypothetical protein